MGVYEIMIIILTKKKQTNVILGYTDIDFPATITRGLLMVIGFWLFYLGFNVGNYMIAFSN